MTSRLDFSIGPVQGFVAQSRRTRDLWGSSYLLSFLSACAMGGIEEAGGEVIEPIVTEDPLYQWVRGCRSGDAPKIGSLPNRFAVEVVGDSRAAARAARAGVDALKDAWMQVSDAVWEKFVEHASSFGAGTRQIWERQISSFWEITWTIGPADGQAGSPFARRKSWRSHRLPDEPGDKCTVMHDLQELSGYVRSQRGDSVRQDQFWEHVCKRTGLLDLQAKEYLCAIALVKRLFPKTGHQALGWEVNATYWPSTVHIGARPWIHRVQSTVPGKARSYAEEVRLNAQNGVFLAGSFSSLDANYYHRESVKTKRLCPLGRNSGRDELDRLLKEIYNATDEQGKQIGQPSSFYALLLADGDRLGKLAGQLGKQRVGEALARFTQQVPGIVKEYGGQTVYAGGDDVLAMHPVPEALHCATRLAQCYREVFRKAPGATLSATVLFAHIRLPLSTVIREAHHLLDNVAKDENGRDSLAVGVLKSGGLNCQWVTTWNRQQRDAVACLDKLIKLLKPGDVEPGLSSALIYRIREVLTRLCEWESWRPGSWGSIPADLDMPALLRAEIGHSLDIRMSESQGMDTPTAALTNPVWRLMQRSCAPSDTRGGDRRLEAGLDALLLAPVSCAHHPWGG